MSSVLTSGNQDVDRFVDESIAVFADGTVTFDEIVDRYYALISLAMRQAARSVDDGATKKEWVLAQVGRLFDAAGSLVLSRAMPWWLAWFAPMLVAGFRQLVLAIASRGIEEIYLRLRNELKKLEPAV